MDFDEFENEDDNSESDKEIQDQNQFLEQECNELMKKRNIIEVGSYMKSLEKFSMSYVQIKHFKKGLKKTKESGPFSFIDLDDSLK